MCEDTAGDFLDIVGNNISIVISCSDNLFFSQKAGDKVVDAVRATLINVAPNDAGKFTWLRVQLKIRMAWQYLSWYTARSVDKNPALISHEIELNQVVSVDVQITSITRYPFRWTEGRMSPYIMHLRECSEIHAKLLHAGYKSVDGMMRVLVIRVHDRPSKWNLCIMRMLTCRSPLAVPNRRLGAIAKLVERQKKKHRQLL